MQGRVGELDAGEVGLDDHHDRTVAALRLADERVAELQAAERGAERQVASLRARIDALSVGLDRKDGAAWLHENHSGAGLFGSDRQAGARCSPATRRRSPRCWVRPPTRWPPRTSAPRAAAVAALKDADGGRAAIVLGDWPRRRPRTGDGDCPTVRGGRSTWSRRRRGCAAR